MNVTELFEKYQEIKAKFPTLTMEQIFEIMKLQFLSEIARKLK